MNKRINVLAAALTLFGAALLRPAPASATYLPLIQAFDSGVTYCCSTRPTAQCCFSTGCMTRDGMCVSLGR